MHAGVVVVGGGGGWGGGVAISVANREFIVDFIFCEKLFQQKTQANKKLPGR